MYIKWENGKPYDINGEEIQFLSDRTINEFHFHLDTEEEYELDSIAAEYGNFYQFMEECPSVYTTTNDNEKYLSNYAKRRKLYPRRYQVANAIARGVLEQEFDPELMPLIPIVEYKLVPTGNIIYYDPLSTAYERKLMTQQEEKECRKRNRYPKKNIWREHAEWVINRKAEGGRMGADITNTMLRKRKENKDE